MGRKIECQLVLEDSNVSREHVEVRIEGHTVLLRDLGSRNGTYVNGHVVKDAEVELQVDAIIRLGGYIFALVEDVAAYVAGFQGLPLAGGPKLAGVRRAIAQFGQGRMPTLIGGETGSGKEVVARLIHEASGRTGAFIAVNCGAIPENLVESEFFGFARGAFSGSDRARDGLFRAADKGTLFLDELGELSLEAQAKLLRATESGEVRPVGFDKPVFVEVRLVAATHRDLGERVTAGKFREDLFFRLSAAKIELPPLRSRREDIPKLCKILQEETPLEFQAKAMERLVVWDYPGNVRELRHVLSQARAAVIAAGAARVALEHLPERILGPLPPPSATQESESPTGTRPNVVLLALDPGVRRSQLEEALTKHKGNMVRVAKELGLARSSLYDELKKAGLDATQYR